MAYYRDWKINKVESLIEDGISGKLLSFDPEQFQKQDENGNPIDISLPVDDLFVPDLNYDNLITEQPCNLNEHLNRRITPVIEDILKILKMYNVTIGVGPGVKPDITYIVEHLMDQVSMKKEAANNKTWGAAPQSQTILQLEKHLKG